MREISAKSALRIFTILLQFAAIMTLREDLLNKDFVITTELNPPKGTNVAPVIANAKKIAGKVSAINITDNPGANMKMCPMAMSYLIQRETGVETIWQVTCRDRNRLGLQSDLLGAHALGIKNILPLRGDEPTPGDHPQTSQCFDIVTEELLQAIYKIKLGKDLNGNNVDINAAGYDICVAAAAHPGLPDLDRQAETMRRRESLGAEFFQTQICFEKEQIAKFIDSIGEEMAAKTLLGITPLKTIGQANFMNKNIWGVSVPESQIDVLREAIIGLDPKSAEAQQQQYEAGLALATELVEYIKTTPLKGVHLMAIGQENKLDTIIDSFKSIK